MIKTSNEQADQSGATCWESADIPKCKSLYKSSTETITSFGISPPLIPFCSTLLSLYTNLYGSLLRLTFRSFGTDLDKVPFVMGSSVTYASQCDLLPLYKVSGLSIDGLTSYGRNHRLLSTVRTIWVPVFIIGANGRSKYRTVSIA
jgi:hypothetical protein